MPRKPSAAKSKPVPAGPPPGSLLVLEPPDPKALSEALETIQRETAPVLAQVAEITITDSKSFSAVDAILGKITDAKSAITDKMEPFIRPVYTYLEWLYSLRRNTIKPFDEAEFQVKSKIATYQLAESKRIRAEQEEYDRKGRELAARLEAERLRMAKEREAEAERESRLGVPDLSPVHGTEAILTTPFNIPAPPPISVSYLAPPSDPAPRGVRSRSRIVSEWRITDLRAFIDAVTLGMVHPGEEAVYSLLVPNQDALEELFIADPDEFGRIPGIEIYETAKVSKH